MGSHIWKRYGIHTEPECVARRNNAIQIFTADNRQNCGFWRCQVRVYVFSCMCACVCRCVCVSARVCKLCMCVCVWLCVCVCMCVCWCVCVGVYVVRICVCVHVCVRVRVLFVCRFWGRDVYIHMSNVTVWMSRVINTCMCCHYMNGLCHTHVYVCHLRAPVVYTRDDYTL